MMSLGVRENYGVLSSEEHRPEYVTDSRAPRYIKRSVLLSNEYSNVLGTVTHTYEDAKVAWTKRLMFMLVVVAVAPFFWPLFVDSRELMVLALPFAVAWLMELVILLLFKESLTDFLASRIFGVPARPTLYIQQGIERKLVRKV